MVFSPGQQKSTLRLLDVKGALSAFMAEVASIFPGSSSTFDIDSDTNLNNWPLTTGEVDASLAYVIASDDCLLLTRRFGVPMTDNS